MCSGLLMRDFTIGNTGTKASNISSRPINSKRYLYVCWRNSACIPQCNQRKERQSTVQSEYFMHIIYYHCRKKNRISKRAKQRHLHKRLAHLCLCVVRFYIEMETNWRNYKEKEGNNKIASHSNVNGDRNTSKMHKNKGTCRVWD